MHVPGLSSRLVIGCCPEQLTYVWNHTLMDVCVFLSPFAMGWSNSFNRTTVLELTRLIGPLCWKRSSLRCRNEIVNNSASQFSVGNKTSATGSCRLGRSCCTFLYSHTCAAGHFLGLCSSGWERAAAPDSNLSVPHFLSLHVWIACKSTAVLALLWNWPYQAWQRITAGLISKWLHLRFGNMILLYLSVNWTHMQILSKEAF